MNINNDLSICDQEPIHIPGLIQPHGYCCSFDTKNNKITSVSANIPNAQELIDQPISRLIPQNLLDDLSERFNDDEHENILYNVELPYFGKNSFDIAQMDPDGEMIIEIHPCKKDVHYEEHNYQLAHTIEKLTPSESIEQMCDLIAKEIKHISTFDRVMVYRFDPEYNGSVISEEKNDGVGSYLGLHFPADDIPAPARELYRKQTVRLISNVDYEAVALIRKSGLSPLDMTYSQLRSVSPIHIEYLKNMNVHATLTISILVHGKLWGLIACHNYEHRYLTLKHLELIRTVGIFFSTAIEARVNNYNERRTIKLRSTLDTIIQSMQIGNNALNLPMLMQHNSMIFSSLFEADGFIFLNDETFINTNELDTKDELLVLIDNMKQKMTNNIFSTNHLASHFPELNETLLTRYAGILFVKVDEIHPTYWLWYRHEKTKTLEWGGDPNNRMTINEDGRIQPRQSFKAFKEIVRYRSERWEDADVDFIPNFILTLEAFF